MPRNSKRKYRQVIDYIEDEVGVDIPRDVRKTAIQSIDGQAAEQGVPIDLDKIGGTDQSGANLLAALQSVADNDELRIAIETDNEGLLKTQDQPLDASASEIDVDLNSQTLGPLDVTDDGSFNIVDTGNNVIEEPLDVSGATVPVDGVDSSHEYESETKTVGVDEVYTVAPSEVWYVNGLTVDGEVYVEGKLVHYGVIDGTGAVKGSGTVVAKE